MGRFRYIAWVVQSCGQSVSAQCGMRYTENGLCNPLPRSCGALPARR